MRHHPRVLIGAIGLIFSTLVLVAVGATFFITPRAVVSASESSKLALKNPLTIRFNIPVNRRSLQPTLSPAIAGSWHWEGGIAGGHFARTLVFEPETIWLSDQKYELALNGLSPALFEKEVAQPRVAFVTTSLPIIVSASVAENAGEVSPDSTISLKLDQPLVDIVDFSFRFEPEAEATIEEDPANNQYILKPVASLKQGQEYRLIADREVVMVTRASGLTESRTPKQKVFERIFRTKTPPQISSFEPQGSRVAPTERKMTVHFSAPMVRQEVEQGLKLIPPTAGSWRWADETTYVFEASGNLPLATAFQVVIPAGVHAQSGSFLERDIALSFQTVGALRVTAISPNNKAGISIASSARLGFDQAPDKQSIQENLTLNPNVPFDLAWEASGVTIKPRATLGYNTKYTILLRKGAKGIYGLGSTSDVIGSFTTEEKVVLLNVAWDRQDRALSCEAAALKMALAAKGVAVTEQNIMDIVGYDSTSHSSGVWGDPDVAFVGDINGSQNTTGYGVHWAPIARAASSWRTARAFSGMTLNEAAREIEAGNPIVIWGVTGPSYYDPWFTPGGKKVESWKGEHVRTLIGFKGSVENPTSFIINDPQAGRLTWSASKLQSNWATFNNTGVIIY